MKLPIGFRLPAESPGVDVAKKTIVQLSNTVRWICAVVCKALGKGNDSSIGRAGCVGVEISAIVVCFLEIFLITALD
jgi:hypothetical protein